MGEREICRVAFLWIISNVRYRVDVHDLATRTLDRSNAEGEGFAVRYGGD